MMPTPGQIERARLVSLWRRRFVREPGLHWHDYDAYEVMEMIGARWSTEDTLNRAYILKVQRCGAHMPNCRGSGRRTISNPPRPRPTPPDLETADDFPY